MSILIDLIILGIIVLSVFLGYKKGLIGVAFKVLSFIIAIIITLLLFKPISNVIINNTQIDESIQNTIEEKLIGEKIEENGEIRQETTSVPNIIVDYINSLAKDSINNSKQTIIKAVSRDLTINIINILVMISLFIISRILLIFAKVLLEAVSELPLVKQFNEIGGIIYGLVSGIFIIYLIFALISFILPMLGQTGIINIIKNSIIGGFVYNNNILLMLFF
ncbi:MAG: hypothetical protein HFJ53_08615 [Clostridia bacterium]|jgi:uncharacterized membrane protein required for colicin V production|nr:hypothetical protein [Clostridia bacterium]